MITYHAPDHKQVEGELDLIIILLILDKEMRKYNNYNHK